MHEMVTRAEIYIPVTLDLSELRAGFGEKT